MKFGVTLDSLNDDIRAAADAARSLGFSGVVGRLRSRAVDLTQLSGSGVREFLHIFSARGLRLIAIQHDLAAAGLHPRGDIDREVDQFSRAISAAAVLDRAMVLCDLGALPPAPADVKRSEPIAPEMAGAIIIPDLQPAPSVAASIEKRDPPFESSANAALREIGRHADRNGVIVAYRSTLASFASLNHSLGDAACPWFGVDLDPVSMLVDDWPVEEIFSRLGSQIRHVRARDGVRGGGNRVRSSEIGKGSVDWRGMLANLDAADFDGAMSVETIDLPDRATAAGRARTYLSQLLTQ